MPQIQTFNADILKAVTAINGAWNGKGYDIGSYFTHNLSYGPDCCLIANHPPKTMCVAAVTEVIVEALNAYFAATNDPTPFQRLPLRSWRGGTKRDIRAHVFMYDGIGCNGTAHALERFGIGVQVKFSELSPGGFINFNRSNGSGHACVFLSYIDAAGNDVAAFDASVMGYRYFSAQGKGLPDAGFGYRWAFFEGHCPTGLPAGRRRDCHVIRSENPKYLCCGHMLHPGQWPASAEIMSAVEATLRNEGLAEALESPEDFEAEMNRELPEPDLSRFDGVTTD